MVNASPARRVILGLTDDDLIKASAAIADAIDAGSDGTKPPVDRLAVKRAAQAWLGLILEGLIGRAAFWALNPASPWRDTFHARLMAELERYGVRR